MTAMQKTQLVFATESYTYMQAALCQHPGMTPGRVERQIFPDGERYQRILSEVAGYDIVLVGGTLSETDTLEMYDLACALVDQGARSLSLVIPYFGYATMERAVQRGEVVTAKTRARLLSAIPQAARGTRAFLFDLHSEGIPYYFEGSIRPIHVYCKPIITQAITESGGKRYVLGATDAGRGKWVESLAAGLGVSPAGVFKRRLDGTTTQVLWVNGNVKGNHVVIYDDMIRTGGSLIGAATAYREAGATGFSVVATHGVLPGKAFSRLQDSGLFDQIICTDTHPRARQLAADGLTVKPIDALIWKCLQQVDV
jgi:ribose-phosphate pyrophosphokinase